MASRRSIVAGLSVLALVALSAPQADAQTASYPDRPLRMIVPFAPGGTTDFLARIVQPKMQELLGQPVAIENRAGAGTTLGAKAVASAEPDGYTLLLGNAATLAIGPTLYKSAGYDPVTSFAPVAFLASVPYVLIVSPSLPVRTVPELVAYAKAHPGKLTSGCRTPPRPTCWRPGSRRSPVPTS